MVRKLSFEERIRRMTDSQLPELCIAVRDALLSIGPEHDTNDELQNNLDDFLTSKRLSTADYHLLTQTSTILGGHLDSHRLNKAGRRAIQIIDQETRRRDLTRS